MPSLTIKGIPPALIESLRASAQRQRRSLNSEVIYRLEQSVRSTPVDAPATLDAIRKLRERATLPHLTDDFLERAIDEGRP